MYRLIASVFTIAFFASMQPALSSEQFLELSAPKKANLQVIGTVPPKRHIELDLGKLRTESARLPDGVRDLEARKRLRARRALTRQNAVTNARRNADKKLARKNSGSEDGVADELESAAKSESAAGSDENEEKVAEASKPKIIKSYKNKKKSSGGGPGKPPALTPITTRPISIE